MSLSPAGFAYLTTSWLRDSHPFQAFTGHLLPEFAPQNAPEAVDA